MASAGMPLYCDELGGGRTQDPRTRTLEVDHSPGDPPLHFFLSGADGGNCRNILPVTVTIFLPTRSGFGISPRVLVATPRQIKSLAFALRQQGGGLRPPAPGDHARRRAVGRPFSGIVAGDLSDQRPRGCSFHRARGPRPLARLLGVLLGLLGLLLLLLGLLRELDARKGSGLRGEEEDKGQERAAGSYPQPPTLAPIASPVRISSTRRFCARPLGSSLGAIGAALPRPFAAIDSPLSPCCTR
jgi:hypothetical protein